MKTEKKLFFRKENHCTMVKAFLKNMIRNERHSFNRLCTANQINLDYSLNKAGWPILQEVFHQRIYSDYFPFYQKCNILDIGGHMGYFALFAQRNISLESQILIAEPDPDNFKILQANLNLNGLKDIQAFPVAIGGRRESVSLYKGKSYNSSVIASNPILQGNKSSETVEMIPLDELLERGDMTAR